MSTHVLPESAYIIQEGVTKGLLDIHQLKLIKILELGCWSPFYGWDFSPHTCRSMHHLGYDITWIDLLEQFSEEFPSIKLDISDPKRLLELGRSRFGLVFDNNFTWDNSCPYLKRKIKEVHWSWWDFLESLNQTIGEILMPGWVYIRWGYRSEFFIKKDWELQNIKNI